MLTLTSPIAVTNDSFPFNAAHRQYKPIDLALYGYVEEEFFVSGLANVYEWYNGGNIPATIRTPDAPYTTRILVRRPTNHNLFSGNVIVELFNWARNYDNPWGGWAESHSYFLDHHDAWVGITIRPCAGVGLKKFNAVRYAPLSFANPLPLSETCPNPGAYPNSPSSPLTEDGLAWDIISQVGALVRSGTKLNPLAGYKVEYVVATSATGGDLSAYVSAIHPIAKLDNGKPIYDGYIIKCTGSPGAVNQCEPRIAFDDPRCKLHVDVPVIRVMTQGDILGKGFHPDWSYLYRQPDSDKHGEQYRLYEVAGSYVFTIYPQLSGPCEKDVVAAGGIWREPPPLPYFDFPLRYIMNGAFANLDLWVRQGIPPPRADRLATIGDYPNMEFALDQFGNTKGGVRTPYVDAPIVTYNWSGKVTPFDDNLLKQLYTNQDNYVRQVFKQTDKLLIDRWVTAADAELMKEQAIRSSIPST
jgi:hypothetical protein